MKISVAMATYNGARFLRQQLDSIFAQAREPDELIVCDDRSEDHTVAILDEYRERAPFPMIVVRNDERLGSTKNFEQAIRQCNGDLVVLCDQDDVWYDHKLVTIEQRFTRDPGLGLIFSNGSLIDEAGSKLRGHMWSRFRLGRKLREALRSAPDAYDVMLSLHFMTGATMAFRSNLLDICLPIPDGIETFIHDRWLAIVSSAVRRVEAIEEELIAYRLHPNQQLGAGKGPILQQYLRPYNCSSDCEALKILRQRLASQQTNPAFMRALDVREAHVLARSMYPRQILSRFRRVLSEYFSGRYQRYPMGRRHAVKDLVVGTR